MHLRPRRSSPSPQDVRRNWEKAYQALRKQILRREVQCSERPQDRNVNLSKNWPTVLLVCTCDTGARDSRHSIAGGRGCTDQLEWRFFASQEATAVRLRFNRSPVRAPYPTAAERY